MPALGRRIWLCTQATDMRRSFDGLSALVRNHLGSNPLDGSWYCFINRRQTQIKVLTFEDGGYCLWSKRLEEGRFARLGPVDLIKRTLSHTEFVALLEGIDFSIRRQRKRWRKLV
ncbi:MAG: IS66 family insertion sequence element accessory protein TnpB [Gammaproteobacteria bacterium]